MLCHGILRSSAIAAGLTALLMALTPAEPAQATTVELVISEEASELERFAASELQRYLKELFQVSATVVSSPSPSAEGIFLLGTSDHHPALIPGKTVFPKLSDQGFVLRQMECKNKPAMAIVGGSPKATLWGVYELVERYGVCYLLSGDVFPEGKQDFYLPEIDRVFEPVFRARWFKTMGDFALGTEGWGMADYRPLLDQLAKLKFNRIRVGSSPSQPFLDLQIKGVKRETATLWYGERFPITADMPGHKLFGNEKEFWNPDLPSQEAGYDKLVAAGQRHCHELIAYAHSRGIEASSVWSVTDFPKEFRSIVPDAATVQQLGALTVGPGPKVRPDNAALAEIAGTVIRTILDEYDDADSYGFPVGTEWNGWIDAYEWAWQELDKQYGINQVVSLQEVLSRAGKRRSHDGGERCIREVKGGIAGLYFLTRLWSSPEVLPPGRKPNARLVVYEPAEELFPILSRVLPKDAELVVVIDYNPTRVLRRRDVLAALPTSQISTTLVLSLHDDSVGLIPLLTTNSLHELVTDMRKHGLSGVCTRQWMISDHDPSMAYLSKASWDATATPRSVYVDQISAVCGKEAVEPMLEAFRELEAVTVSLEDHGMGISFPWPGMMTQYWTPAPLQKVRPEDKAGYQRALAAVRKAPLPSRPEGKAYLQYWIGRLEFGVGYLDVIETVKKAAIAEKAAADAKAKGDLHGFQTKLREAGRQANVAQTTIVQAIEAFAGVAKNRADLGAIATMGEFVYRPLKRKAEELQAECDKLPQTKAHTKETP